MQHVILTLDHERQSWPLYRNQFEAAGYLIQTTATIEDALGNLDRRRFDAIVMEIVFPQGPRLDYLHHIVEAGRNSKVVIFSGFPEYRLNFQTWAADAFLPKAFGLPSLVGTVDHLLKPSNNGLPN